jgi:hypothetical protein
MATTPGPWFTSRVMEDDYGFSYCTVGPFNTADQPDGDHVEEAIAEVRGINHDAEANARLIAAAPDLYAALQMCHQVIEQSAADGFQAMRDLTDAELGRLWISAYQAARTALAKADGR